MAVKDIIGTLDQIIGSLEDNLNILKKHQARIEELEKKVADQAQRIRELETRKEN